MGPNPQQTADLDTFTEEILKGKLHFLCSECFSPVILIRKLTVSMTRLSELYSLRVFLRMHITLSIAPAKNENISFAIYFY